MNKEHLVQDVAERLGITRTAANHAVTAVLDTLTVTLAAGEKVTITGFGTFERFTRPAHQARNLRTGEPVAVPERHQIRFKSGQTLKRLVNE